MMSGGLQNLAGAAALAARKRTSINSDGQTIKAASWESSAASATPSFSRGFAIAQQNIPTYGQSGLGQVCSYVSMRLSVGDSHYKA